MTRPTPRQEQARAGRIVTAHGRRVLVEDDSGSRHPCRLFGRRLDLVCGDRVRWVEEETEGAEGLVLEVLPRRSELLRISQSGEPERVVANLDLLVAVLAPVPAPDFSLCDRYLAAAEWAGLAAAVVLNKDDLPAADNPSLQQELETYRRLGYPVGRTSKRREGGTDSLRDLMQGRTGVLVGQSGVGKSSLINVLVPGVEAAVQEISRATEEGRHTTTAAALYHLPGGGALMDSPGVRDFSPPLPSPRDVASGFRELAELAVACRYPDCRHTGEPGCMVDARLATGEVSARRLDSYRQLLKLSAEMEERRRTSGRLRGGSSRRGRRIRK